MIIGVDHGFGYIKTVHSSFVAGVTPFGVEPPLKHSVLKYDGKYYVLGGERQGVQRSKVDNEDYYLMTLGAIAEELKYRKVTEANVILGAGLPLTRFGIEKAEFKQYLAQNSEVTFEYEGIHYKVKISDVRLFPQGYSSIIKDMDKLLDGEDEVLLVDIGSWTIDILPIVNGIPNMAACKSEPNGIIKVLNNINEEVNRELGAGVSEMKIQTIMQGKSCKIPIQYREIIENGIRRYAKKLMDRLKEEYEIATTPLIFVGGGSCVIKNFYEYNDEMTTIITDFAANAKGYEYLVSDQERKRKEARG